MLNITVDFSQALSDLDGVAQRVSEAVRPAVWQGVKILREEAELRAPRSRKSHYFYSTGSGGEPHVFVRGKKAGRKGSKYLFHPGDLKKSVYVKFIPENSIDGQRAQYAVSYRKNPSETGYVPYGSMVHNGVKRSSGDIPARPFIRHAYDALGRQAEKRIVQLIKGAANGKTDYRGG